MSTATFSGTEFLINSTASSTQRTQQVVATADGGFVVVWQSNHGDGSTYDVMGQRYNSSGVVIGSEFTVNQTDVGDQEDVDLFATSNGFVVTWESNNRANTNNDMDAWARSFFNSGSTLNQTQLNYADDAGQQYDVDGASPNLVVWVGTGGLILSTFTNAGTSVVLTVPTPVNAFLTNPTITSSSTPGLFMITFGNNAMIFDDSTNSFSSAFPVGNNPSVVALQNGNFMVLTSSNEIEARIFDTNGQQVGGVIPINETTAGIQTAPQAVALSGGGYFVVWTSENQDGSGFGIYGQRFTDSGRAIGTEILINTTTTGHQVSPQVDELDNGQLIVTWTSQQDDAGDIYGQILDMPIAELDQVINGTTGDDVLVGDTGFDTISGFEGDDLIKGDVGDDSLVGGSGNDTLEGAGGNDCIEGGDGNDKIDGGNLRDKIFGQKGDDLLHGGRSRDRVEGGKGDDTVFGGDGHDRVSGGRGNDIVDGGNGNDRVNGGLDDDTLTGGTGVDTFEFRTGDGTDRITDFTDGEDMFLITSGASDFTDVTVLDLGADALVVFSDVVIRLENVDHTLIGAEDFIF